MEVKQGNYSAQQFTGILGAKDDYSYSTNLPPQYSINASPHMYNKGYSRLPEEDDYPPPPSNPGHYAPMPSMPPVAQQQMSSNTNVVVVNQPQTQPIVYSAVRVPQASTFLMLTSVLMLLCFLHGNLITFLCLVPAIICSCIATDHNSAERYEEAKTCGNMSLFCNLCALIYFVILIVAIVAVVISILAIGASLIGDIADALAACHIQIDGECLS